MERGNKIIYWILKNKTYILYNYVPIRIVDRRKRKPIDKKL